MGDKAQETGQIAFFSTFLKMLDTFNTPVRGIPKNSELVVDFGL